MNVLIKEGKRVEVIESDIAERAVEIGRKKRKTFRTLTGTGRLTEIVNEGMWTFVPFEDDDSVIPREAMKRVELLKENGIPIIDLIVAHEDPIARQAIDEDLSWKRQKDLVMDTAIATAGVFTMMAGFLLASAILVDPALICVLGDSRETWLECCTWHEGYE